MTNVSAKISGGQLQDGDACHNFLMRTIDDRILEASDYRGRKLWIAFYRYAGCPLCASHLAQVLEARTFLESAGITFIAVYDCDPMNVPGWIRKNASQSLQVVADKSQALHEQFGAVKLYAKLFTPGSAMAWAKATGEGFFQQKLDGSLAMMPAHVLVDESGQVVKAFYAEHAGDNISWKIVREFGERKSSPQVADASASPKNEGVTGTGDVTTITDTNTGTNTRPKTGVSAIVEAAQTKSRIVPREFAVNYKWKLKIGSEADFLATWTWLEQQTRERYPQYMGARLYLDSEQYVAAFTVWTDKASWEQYWITKEQTLPDYLRLSAFVERTFDAQICRSIFDSVGPSVQTVRSR